MSETAELSEGVGVAESGLLGRAPRVGDRVAGRASDGRLGVGDDLAVLDVEAADLGEGAGVGAVGGDELSNDGDLLRGVDGHVRAVEGEVTLAVGVEVTASLGRNMLS